MAETNTITWTDAEASALDLKASQRSITRTELIEAEAKLLARGIRQDMLNAWWSDLGLEAQQTLYDSRG